MFDNIDSDTMVVLVDDGSTDGTLNELKKFSHYRNSIIVGKENEGFTKSLSRITLEYVNRYKPKYIAIHGAGDICTSQKFVNQVKYLEEKDDVVAAGCGHYLISQTSGAVLDTLTGFVEASEDTLLTQTPFTHGTVVYRTAAFNTIGGYDIFFKCCQDWELYTRLVKLGKIVRIDGLWYKKVVFADGVSYKPSKKIEQMVYKDIAVSGLGEINEKIYLKKKAEECGIEVFLQDKRYLTRFTNSQKSLIKKGEFNLASEWCEIITSHYPEENSKQKSLKVILTLFIKIKLAKIISILYSLSKKFLKAKARVAQEL